jgi:hypothetical protein
VSNARTIDLGYRAREQFKPFHRRSARFGVVVAHRRAGKTVAAIHDLVDAALRIKIKDGRFAYVAPYYAQAKDVAWVYLKRAVAPIPGVAINETELRVDLPNGSRIRLYGADNYDRLRGIYLDGVVLDEYADMDPRAWSEVIRAALADRQGWAVFIGTPKGRNTFADLYERAEADPEWYSLRLRASETGIIPESELLAMKAELSANEFRREMETDFDAAVEGAYFAEQLHAAQTEGRITTLAADPILQVRAFWDLGVSDSTSIWLAQWQGQSIHWLDYIEGAGQPLGYYVDQMRRRGWENAKCVLPHDGAHRDAVTATRFEDHLTAAGFAVETIPNQGKGAAIKRVEAARRLFPRMWFDVEKTSDGRRALAAYHEKRDEKRMIGLGPMHDWASHGSDAFGLGCVAYEEPKAAPKPFVSRNWGNESWMGA